MRLLICILTYNRPEMEPANNNLKARRKALGYSLRELERYTGVSNSYISQLENGSASSPTIHKARQLAFVLKTTVEELFPDTHQTMNNKTPLCFTVKEIENGYLLEQNEPKYRAWGFRNDEELACFIGAYLLELPH